MMKKTTDVPPSVTWFAEWIKHAATASPLRSIIIGAKCSSHLNHIGLQVASYLNEFDSEAEGHWHAFTPEILQQFADEPNYRELLLSDDHRSGPDLERIAHSIINAGGAVIEDPGSLHLPTEPGGAFRVCLCERQPTCLDPCHMWLDPDQFPRESLVSIIADSFLDWNSKHAYHASKSTAGGAQVPARGAEPQSPFPALL
jgi:hypothetical protein